MVRFSLRNVIAPLSIVFIATACNGSQGDTPPPVAVTPVASVAPATENQAAAELFTAERPSVMAQSVMSTTAMSGANQDDPLDVGELAIGQPGYYVNLTYGYVAHFPEAWYTGFGNRPVVASFSNLDPGTTNREQMSAAGCLLEIGSSTNIYGFSLDTLLAQSPQTYANAEFSTLAGSPAVRITRDNAGLPFITQLVQVVHDGRIFTINADMARAAGDICTTALEAMLRDWIWFEPDFVSYRNSEIGYGISYPRSWFSVESGESGFMASSTEVSPGAELETLASEGMVVRTRVHENPQLLPLKGWLTANVPNLGLTNDIDLETLRGVRSVPAASDGLQQITGYYQGPLGKIYAVETTFPSDRAGEFRPIANAIIYSFTF